jgi:hypothetical protein
MVWLVSMVAPILLHGLLEDERRRRRRFVERNRARVRAAADRLREDLAEELGSRARAADEAMSNEQLAPDVRRELLAMREAWSDRASSRRR